MFLSYVWGIKDKEKHVVIEPSKNELNALIQNRDNNKFKFQIENSAISNSPLFSLYWGTYLHQVENSVPVNTVLYDELLEKYKLNFNVLVIDNEGHFVNMLKAFPDILNGIRLLIIEHDFNSQSDVNYFYRKMRSNHFTIKDTFLKEEDYGPGIQWPDGVTSDPVFVSAWVKRSCCFCL